MTTIFTLIAYKRDGVDTCRGGVMDSWGADFILETYLNKESIAKRWGQIQWKNIHEHDRREPDYDFDILINGAPVEYAYNYTYGSDDGFDDIIESHEALFEEIKVLRDNEIARLKKIADEKASKLEQEKVEKERKVAEDNLQRERAEYERLSAKFNGQNYKVGVK
jgi:hypothetical protein